METVLGTTNEEYHPIEVNVIINENPPSFNEQPTTSSSKGIENFLQRAFFKGLAIEPKFAPH